MRRARRAQFRLLFLGRTASLLGSAFAPVALAFAVPDNLDGSATDLGIVLAAIWIPQVFLSRTTSASSSRSRPRWPSP